MIIFDLKNDIAGVPYISTLRASPPKTEPVPKWTMNFYYYLFSCAYWYSIKDLKEDSSPQEYAFIYVSILDLLIFLILSGIVNLIMEHNLLNGGVVLLV